MFVKIYYQTFVR